LPFPVTPDGSELRDQLALALGSAYDLERELGGGGMARVFVAMDTRLGRRVVVKVLHQALAAGASVAPRTGVMRTRRRTQLRDQQGPA
jgi:hypothetical protein